MKTLTSLLTALALTLTFGIAYADEIATWGDNKDTLTTIFEDLSLEHETGTGLQGAAPGGTREDKAGNAKTEREIHINYWNADRSTD